MTKQLNKICIYSNNAKDHNINARTIILFVPKKKYEWNRELISIRVDNNKLKKMYIKISIYSFIACENIVNSFPQNMWIHIFVCVFVTRKKNVKWAERKRKWRKDIYFLCTHTHTCVFLCPNRKSNIINGFRNYLFNIANDRTKTMCVHALNLIKSVILQKCARVSHQWFSTKMNEIVSHHIWTVVFRWLNAYCVCKCTNPTDNKQSWYLWSHESFLSCHFEYIYWT